MIKLSREETSAIYWENFRSFQCLVRTKTAVDIEENCHGLLKNRESFLPQKFCHLQ